MTTLAIIGHEAHGKTTLAAAIARQNPPFQVDDPADWTQASQWNGVILVVSAPDGPMPGSRNALITAKRSGITKVVVYLSKVDLVDDSELVDLVELEVAELCAAHGPPGEPTIVRGSAMRALAGDKSPTGVPAIEQLVAAAAVLTR